MPQFSRLMSATVVSVLLSFAGSASAELLTYEFTANIDSGLAPAGTLPIAVGDSITGTFSYDTATPAGALMDLSSGAMTYVSADYATGSIDTEGVSLAGATTTVTVQDFSNGGTEYDSVDIFSMGDTILGSSVVSNAIQYIGLFGGDAFSGAALPETLSFLDFEGTTYRLSGKLADGSEAFLSGTLSGFRLLGGGDEGGSAASVPELSGEGAMGAFALLFGMALLAMTRRKATVQVI